MLITWDWCAVFLGVDGGSWFLRGRLVRQTALPQSGWISPGPLTELARCLQMFFSVSVMSPLEGTSSMLPPCQGRDLSTRTTWEICSLFICIGSTHLTADSNYSSSRCLAQQLPRYPILELLWSESSTGLQASSHTEPGKQH